MHQEGWTSQPLQITQTCMQWRTSRKSFVCANCRDVTSRQVMEFATLNATSLPASSMEGTVTWGSTPGTGATPPQGGDLVRKFSRMGFVINLATLTTAYLTATTVVAPTQLLGDVNTPSTARPTTMMDSAMKAATMLHVALMAETVWRSRSISGQPTEAFTSSLP